MKYKITKTDLQINNKLHSEGSEVELTKEQTKGIEDYLIPINTNGHSELHTERSRSGSEESATKKSKRKTKGDKK